jgi:hypothetical protein
MSASRFISVTHQTRGTKREKGDGILSIENKIMEEHRHNRRDKSESKNCKAKRYGAVKYMYEASEVYSKFRSQARTQARTGVDAAGPMRGAVGPYDPQQIVPRVLKLRFEREISKQRKAYPSGSFQERVKDSLSPSILSQRGVVDRPVAVRRARVPASWHFGQDQ